MIISCFVGRYGSHNQDLQNFHCMFLGRYWAHVQDLNQFLIRIFRISWATSFPTFSKCWRSKILIFVKLRCLTKMVRELSWIILSYLVGPTFKTIVLGVMDTSQNPKLMKRMSFQVFPTWNLKVTNPKRSRIILRSFRAPLFLKSAMKMAPRPPRPLDPKSGFQPHFADFP